ncbi:MAG: DUF1538 domain-containing protein [Lachnospirales bacterium]
MNVIGRKFKEVFLSVLPIVILVLILNFTIAPIDNVLLARFMIGSVFIIFGLTIFLLGVDIGVTPLGALTGTTIAKTNSLKVVVVAGIVLGFFISIAEPGLMVLANQVNEVTSGEISGMSILVIVSLGLAIMLSIGFIRIFYNIPLYKLLLVLYVIIFVFAIFSSRDFLAISFDASGSTTGILAVPFILSLSVGISTLEKNSKSSEKDSFGLVAIASTGAIISVLIFGNLSGAEGFSASLTTTVSDTDFLMSPFINGFSGYFLDSCTSILPLFFMLIILQKTVFKLSNRQFRKLVTGFIFAFIGLLMFLTGVNAGFMDVGTSLGSTLVSLENKAYIVIIGFIMGVVTILAEPAVYVLTRQIEDVTSGYVKKKAVLISLALGVGLAVALSVIRVLVVPIQLWHYLLPGYVISLGLMFFIPKLFVGIAFDAGGVATGPITATFILAFVQGAANTFEGADLMVDGFGMIAMVAMTPIITLEVLGLLFARKSLKVKGENNE